MSPGWDRVPLRAEVDLTAGGRWTSLRAGEREWLWHHPDPEVLARRRTALPGAPFVDAGGGEECLPTVGGHPDHGALWTAPWSGAPGDASASGEGLHLRRRLEHRGGAVRVEHTVTGAPGRSLLHATHLLLDASPDARLELPGAEGLLCWAQDAAGSRGRRSATWPPEVDGRCADRLGPDDGSATLVLVPGVREALVVDGAHALHLTWSVPDAQPTGVLLWRNLAGWPPGGPYRSTGVEPLLGRASELDECGRELDGRDDDGLLARAAVLDPGGHLTWTVMLTALTARTSPAPPS